MPSAPKPAQSNEQRLLVWHVDPNDPAGPLVNHLPNVTPKRGKRRKSQPKRFRKKKS